MLKRSGALVLTLLYMVTVVGFALNLHYCGTVLTAVKIDATPKGCPGMVMPAKMKCCTDKRLDVKIKDAHQSQAPSFLAKVFSIQLPRLHFASFFLSAQKSLLERFFDHGPPGPPSGSIATYIKNCIFRI